MDTDKNQRNIKLIIAYDGTDFAGWQAQGNGRRTVQGVAEEALFRLHGHHVALAGAGRTDSGVHAAGQAANFYTSIAAIPAPRFVPALNGFLPPDVRILEAAEAPPGFHARFDARERIYRYFLLLPGGEKRPALPHEARYNLALRRRPRLGLLAGYARLLRGEMDLSLFISPGDPALARGSRSPCRFINYACFYPGGPAASGESLIFEISANAFLWKMVRTILGTMLFFEERGVPAEEFKLLLGQGRRADAGPTAPPQGLFLWRVGY